MNNTMFYLMLLSTVLGILSGIFFPEQMLNLKWLDLIYINVLKLIVTPLIFSALVYAIISMGSIKRLKLIWVYTICYVLFSVFMAVLIGVILTNIFKPGAGMQASIISLHTASSQLEALNSSSSFFNALLPSNKINSAANFEILPIILFSIVFGIACISLGESSRPVTLLIVVIRNIFAKIIIWLMYLAPIGLFTLLGSAIAEAYTNNILLNSIRGLALFILVFLIGLFLQCLWQFAIIKFFIKRNPQQFLKNGSKALLMAFSTSSSLISLPMALVIAKEEKINKEIADLVLPFSTTINLAGTAMYEAVAVLFFCQILEMHLSIFSQIEIFCTAILAGVGAGGIPEGGLITMMIVLKSVNIPTSAIILLVPFDRILDRMRTMVNVWGDLVCAMTVNHFISKKHSTLQISQEVQEL